MNIVGSLILLLDFAMLTVVGIIATGDPTSEAQNSNDSIISNQAAGVESALNPIFTVFGFTALIISSMIAINAFR